MASNWRRAQHDYWCSRCPRLIPAGTMYVYNGARQKYPLLCSECAKTKRTIRPPPYPPSVPSPTQLHVTCPFCRVGSIVENRPALKEWIVAHRHGPLLDRFWQNRDHPSTLTPDNVIIRPVRDRALRKDPIEASAALSASALKWMDILNMPELAFDMGSRNCPLCEAFRGPGCSACPVKLYTGEPHCAGSPYEEWQQHHWLDHDEYHDLRIEPGCAECRRLAENELEFLLMLSDRISEPATDNIKWVQLHSGGCVAGE